MLFLQKQETLSSFLKESYDNLIDSLPKDPLPYFTLGFTGGICFAFTDISLSYIALYYMAGLLFILLWASIKKSYLISYFILFYLCLGFITGGGVTLYHKEFSYHETSLHKITYLYAQKAKIIKIIDRGQKAYFLLRFSSPIQENIHSVRLIAPKNKKDFLHDDIIEIKARLYPLPKAYFKGDYDFSFYAKTHNIQATGRITTATLITRPAGSIMGYIQTIRNNIEQKLAQNLSQTKTAITTAMTTGNRSLLDDDTQDLWKYSGIFHLLSISGLHMTVMTSLAFFTCRRLLFIYPPLVRRYDTKKISAFLALIIAFFYALLSGSSIPAMRAFITMSVVLTAIIMDRRAISMRNALMAYILILIMNPAQIYNISLGLSFAAIFGILFAVSVISDLRKNKSGVRISLFQKIGFFLLINLCVSYAGMPLSVYAFGVIPVYGFITNLLAVPLTGILLMPLITISVLLMPLDLHGLPLMGVSYLLDFIDIWACFISGLEDNLQYFSPPSIGILVLFYGALYLMVMLKGRIRYCGLGGIMLSLFFYYYIPMQSHILLSNQKTLAFMDISGAMRILTKDPYFKPSSYLQDRLTKQFGQSPNKDYYITYCDKKIEIFTTIHQRKISCQDILPF